jgi:L-cysteine desulfidase
MKKLKDLLITEGSYSPIDMAKSYVYVNSKKFNFDFAKFKEWLDSQFDDDKIADYTDKWFTSSQAAKFVDTLRKIISDEKEYKKVITKKQQDEKSAEDAANAKKMKKAEAVKKFVQELMDNDIKFIIDGKKYPVSVTDDGDIKLGY